MIAVRVSKDHRAAIVGSPGYFRANAKPKTPHDLLGHRCINFRHGAAGVYRWEFDKGRKSLSVAVNGPLIVDDVETLTRTAIDGVGLAFIMLLLKCLKPTRIQFHPIKLEKRLRCRQQPR